MVLMMEKKEVALIILPICSHMSVYILGGKVSVREIKNWLILNDEHFQNMLEKSDMYADIESIADDEYQFQSG